MKIGTTVLEFSYSATGDVVSVLYRPSSGSNVRYYYARNAQGDIIGLVNSSGTLVVRYAYDSWGKPIVQTDSTSSGIGTLNPFRYRGYIYDTETGLYYLKSRYYDPETGRFINADMLMYTGQGVLGCNMFAYCLNNPVNMTDESGRFCISAILLGVLCVTSATLLSGCSTVSDLYTLEEKGKEFNTIGTLAVSAPYIHTANVIAVARDKSAPIKSADLIDNKKLKQEYITEFHNDVERFKIYALTDSVAAKTLNKDYHVTDDDIKYLSRNMRYWAPSNNSKLAYCYGTKLARTSYEIMEAILNMIK